MTKIKCISCDYQNELLLMYINHYKHTHLSSHKTPSTSTDTDCYRADKIQCHCGHLNHSDFSFCSECGWDLRFNVDLPQNVRDMIQKENEQKKQDKKTKQAQIHQRNETQQINPDLQKKISFMLGQVTASQLLNTNGQAIVIKKVTNTNNSSSTASSKPKPKPKPKSKKKNTNTKQIHIVRKAKRTHVIDTKIL